MTAPLGHDADDSGSQPTSRWRVAPTSSFIVTGTTGSVPVIQINKDEFVVTTTFAFDHAATIDDLVRRLVDDGMTETDARRAVDDARTYVPSEDNPTDLASIPPFMRWFENTYGCHTLAAIIHDRLILDAPNSGALASDALADRFFRLMMGDAGVPWLKRWIMWSAVALRSRWAAGGWRRVAIGAWVVAALVGIGAFATGTGALLFDAPAPAGPVPLVVVAAVLPLVSAPLWGRQYVASFIGAVVALWVLPAAVFGVFGFGVYSGLEWVSRRFGVT